MAPNKKKAKEQPSVEKPKPKKKEVEIPSRDARIASLMADVNEKSGGKAALMSASDYVLPYLTKRLPTGLLTLDIELRGGIPAGGVSHVAGKRSAGKTTLAWLVIRQLQFLLGKKMKVLLAMTELQADRGQGKMLGVKVSMGMEYVESMNKARKNAGIPPLTPEEVAYLLEETGTIHELHAMSAEDFYDVLLRAVDENMYHLIVIDSIGNILSAAEQENESVHDKVYGGAAGPNTTFLKKLTNLLTMRNEWGQVRDTAILGINQVRDNIKDPKARMRSPGGNALEHAKLVDVWVESGAVQRELTDVYTPGGWTKKWLDQWKDINWEIVKGKAGMHEGAKGTYVFDYRIESPSGHKGGVDFFKDTIVAGVSWGVIQQSGTWMTLPKPGTTDDAWLKAQGMGNMSIALFEDARQKAGTGELSAMDYIRETCFRKAGITIDYDWAD